MGLSTQGRTVSNWCQSESKSKGAASGYRKMPSRPLYQLLDTKGLGQPAKGIQVCLDLLQSHLVVDVMVRVVNCSLARLDSRLLCLLNGYPLARRSIPHRWRMYRTPLERNPKDSRHESFQVQGNRTVGYHQWINTRFDEVKAAYPKTARAALLEPFVHGSIQQANSKRISLTILQPDNLDLYFKKNEEASTDEQYTLFDTGEDDQPSVGARQFELMPRIRFRDEGGQHDLMLRDWGAFEFQRKNGPAYFRDNLAGALNLTSESSLLVSNMNNKRNTWLVISVLNGIREERTPFDVPEPEISIPAQVKREVFQRDQ